MKSPGGGFSAIPGWSGRTILSLAVRGRRMFAATATSTVQGLRWGSLVEYRANPEESSAEFYLKSLENYLRESEKSPETVLWTLSRKEILFKRFQLPLAARENLDWVVKSQLKSRLPLPVEETRFDYRVEESSDKKHLEVYLYAFDNQRLDHLQKASEAIGAECAEIRPASMVLSDALAATGQREHRAILWGEGQEVEGILIAHDNPTDSALAQVGRVGAFLEEWRQAGATVEVWSGDPQPTDWPDSRKAGWRFDELPDSAETDPLATLAGLAILNHLRGDPVRVNLLPESLRPASRFGQRAVMRLLVTAIVAALVLLGGSVAWKRHAWNSALEERVGSLEPVVQKVQELQARKEKATARLGAFAQAAPNSVKKIYWLEKVTGLLPQATWLSRLTIEDDRVVLEGYSDAADQLIPLLENSGLVRQAGFSAPIVSGGVYGREFFRIQAVLVGNGGMR